MRRVHRIEEILAIFESGFVISRIRRAAKMTELGQERGSGKPQECRCRSPTALGQLESGTDQLLLVQVDGLAEINAVP